MATTTAVADVPARGGGGRSVRAWHVLAVLFLLWMVSFLDRGVLALLVTPIRADLGLSDFDLSLLQGFSFALCYAIAGLPIGWMVDRFPRRPIIFVGITIWALATAGSGLATSFGQLFFARMLVGIGEATLSPAGYSLLTDVFPRRRLSLAISVAAMGGALGAGLAYMVSGLILELGRSGLLDLPGIGHLQPWQQVFMIIGLPGLLIGLLVFTFAEPVRRGGEEGVKRVREGGDDAASSMRFFFAHLRRHGRFYACHIGGFATFSIANYGFQAWAAEYMRRAFGWSAMEIGATFGPALSIAVFGAYAVGGLVVDRLFDRGMKDAHLRVFFWFAIASIPLSAATLLTGNPWTFLVLSTVWGLFSISFGGAAAAALQITTPPQFRGRISSIYLLVIVLLGMTVGPSSVAALTQFVFADEASLGAALLCLMAVVYPLGAALLAGGMKPMRAIIAAGETAR